MKYLVSLLVVILSFSVVGMKMNQADRWDPGEFSYEDSIFYSGQTKTLYVIFDYNGGHVLDESKPMLDSMANFLLKNKHLAAPLIILKHMFYRCHFLKKIDPLCQRHRFFQ